MSYVHITRTAGREPGRVRPGPAASSAPGTPAGQLAHHVGVVDGVLVIVDVWDSRAAADRFAAEHPVPRVRAGRCRTGPRRPASPAFEAPHASAVPA